MGEEIVKMAETVTMEAPVALVFSETEMFARFRRPSTEFAVSVAKLSVVLSCNKLQQIVKEGIITV